MSVRDRFSGYLPYRHNEISDIWQRAIFVPDANVLLGLYRFSDSTRNEFLKILRDFKSRLWVPQRVAQEFFNNRLNVIGEQIDNYRDMTDSIVKIEKSLSNQSRQPFLSPKTLAKLQSTLKEVKDELDHGEQAYEKRINTDEIVEEIAELINESVGAPTSDERTREICGEGELRYKKKIPPGYKDAAKPDDVDEVRKFGDLIIWKQIIEKSKKDGMPAIFICDDAKEDWWLIHRGKTIGPRPELIQEFKEETDCQIAFYSAFRFFEFAGKKLKRPLSKSAASEVKTFRKRHLERKNLVGDQFDSYRRWSQSNAGASNELYKHEMLKKKYEKITSEIEELESEISKIEKERHALLSMAGKGDVQSNWFHEELDSMTNAMYRKARVLDRLIRQRDKFVARTYESDGQSDLLSDER